MLEKSASKTMRKRQRKTKRITRQQVLKMLAVMDQQTAGPSTSVNDAPRTPDTSAQNDEFLQTGRTGRRNALPDILSNHSAVSTADLPSKMGSLTTEEKDLKDTPGPSSSS